MAIGDTSNGVISGGASPRLFFLHIPKTAGTTLTSFLEQQYPVHEVRPEVPLACDDWLLQDTPVELWRSEALPSRVKQCIAELSNYALVARFHPTYFLAVVLQWFHPEYRIVTTLREPVSRVVSHIEHLRKAETQGLGPGAQEAHRLANELGIVELMAHPHPLLQAWLHNFQSKMLAGSQVLNPASLLGQATRNLAKIEYVGTVERLPDFMDMLAFSLGWPLSERFPALNTNRVSKVKAEGLTHDERSAITDANAIDIQLWQQASERLDRDHRKALADAAMRAWSTSRRQAPRTQFVFTMDEALPGSGWHERERGAEHFTRWIGPEPKATLYFFLAHGRSHHFRVSLISLITPTILDETQIFVNGREVAFEVESAAPYTVVKFTAPRSCFAAGGVSQLEFRSLRAYNASDLYDVADHRPKTIAVERIEVEALSDDDDQAPQGS
jgi:hypothetical protein